MEIGRLDRIVTIQSVSYANDDYGDSQTPTWSTYKSNVWARKEYPGGRVDEKFEADQLVAVSTVIWTIRYDSGVTPQMRIDDGTDKWYIVRIEEMGRKWALKLTCENRDNE